VDSRKDLRLVPVDVRDHEYRTNRRIHLSSTAIEGFHERLKRRHEKPLPPEFFDLKAMRIVEGGMLRISFRNLQAVYPLPLGY
jgi:hypothetical protein